MYFRSSTPPHDRGYRALNLETLASKLFSGCPFTMTTPAAPLDAHGRHHSRGPSPPSCVHSLLGRRCERPGSALIWQFMNGIIPRPTKITRKRPASPLRSYKLAAGERRPRGVAVAGHPRRPSLLPLRGLPASARCALGPSSRVARSFLQCSLVPQNVAHLTMA